MAARLRACPRCGHVAPTPAFPRVEQGGAPIHADLRRRCPACGLERRAWAFAVATDHEHDRPPDAA